MSAAANYVWLITGGSRGIGLEMARQLLEQSSNTVIATARDPANASTLHNLKNTARGTLHIIALDVADRESIRKCADEAAAIVGDKGIDFLVNNAGINAGAATVDTAYGVDIDAMENAFKTNVFGPAFISQVLLPLVEKSNKKTIVHISSTLGSKGADLGEAYAAYSMSKSALNMLTYKQAKQRPDITSVCVCPGWLQTDMGGANADYPVSVGVEGILKAVAKLTPEDSGKFFNFKGERVPW